MPRTSRQHSDTGVYHVMLRGIDRQDIFADNQDRGKLHQKNRPYFHSYYHSDHLGSSSLITDSVGNVTQQVEYLPYGEVFLEKRSDVDYHTPYRFNGKELDEETGLYYYGARYMNPRLSIWYGTDPQEDLFPDISTYCYTLGNPIKHQDPNGDIPLITNIVGGIAGGLVEYGSQVVGNIAQKGLKKESFTNVDYGDIAIAAGEGFITSGGSIVRKAVVKGAIRVTATVAKNAIDINKDGAKVNSVGETVRGSVVDAVGSKMKMKFKNIKIAKTKTANKAIESARANSHSKGRPYSSREAKQVASRTRAANKTKKGINSVVTSHINHAPGNAISNVVNKSAGNHERHR